MRDGDSVTATPGVNHIGSGPQPGEAVDPTDLEDFLALIAHEVNTPLAVADLATESALVSYDSLDRDELRELLEVIDRNLQLAMLLMKRLSLARDLAEGMVELSREPVDLAELIHQSANDLRHVVLSGHPLDLDLPATYAVEVDPTAIREILFNLLSNAAKYSAKDAPITVTLHRAAGRAVVEVRNHGSGVTPGDTEAIFGKYFQGDTGSGGVGLGLFISRGVARAHGGDITVRPADDAGSIFRLELPHAA
jgi:signal transduction histidine kinase